jgi:hypothetical protein
MTNISGNMLLWTFYCLYIFIWNRLYGLMVRVPTYRSRDPGFDSRRYRVFWEVVGLDRGLLNLVSITEDLLEWKSSGSGSRKPSLTAVGDPLRWPRDTLYQQMSTIMRWVGMKQACEIWKIVNNFTWNLKQTDHVEDIDIQNDLKLLVHLQVSWPIIFKLYVLWKAWMLKLIRILQY